MKNLFGRGKNKKKWFLVGSQFVSCCLLLVCFSFVFSVCKENLLSFFLFITLMDYLFYSGLFFFLFFRSCAVLLHVGLSGLWALNIYVGLIYFNVNRLCGESGCIYFFCDMNQTGVPGFCISFGFLQCQRHVTCKEG